MFTLTSTEHINLYPVASQFTMRNHLHKSATIDFFI